MAVVLYLFDPCKYQARETASEADFKANFGNLLPIFSDAFNYAFRRMTAERSRRKPTEINSRWFSNTVNCHLYHYLLHNYETGKYVKKGNNTFYLEKSNFRLTFKKVDNRFKPSYNSTRNSEQFERNLTNSLNDTSPIIFMGYQVNETWDVLLGSYAISRDNISLKWRIDLDRKVVSIPSAKILASNNNERVITEPEIKIRKRKKAN